MESLGFGKTFNGVGEVPITGVKLYYADGTITRHPYQLGDLVGWLLAPSSGVQSMNVYYDRFFEFQFAPGATWETASYKRTLAGFDVYWFSPTAGFGAGRAGEAPADAIVKQGTEIAVPAFEAIYFPAYAERTL